MKNYASHFKGKKITVMGLGLLGRGVGDIEFLATCGAEIIVTDKKSAEELAPSVESLKKYSNITFVLGEHRLEDFRDRDMVFKAAGVPIDSPFIAEARKHKVPVVMSAALFSKLSGATIVGVTGTRGKTTVTMLMHEVLKKAYEGTHTAVYLGGNIRGVATLPFLETVKTGDIAVLELDSWQLQGFGDLSISPHVAVFTTFMDDHLNYYKNDVDAYFADKAKIFEHQTPEDVLILGSQVEHIMKASFKKMIKSRVRVADAAALPKQWKLQLPGEHNQYNAGLAYAALCDMGIDEDLIKEVFEKFSGVEGRLQKIAEHNGVSIFNDNNSTTPDATIVALKAVGNEASKDVVLIIGGADKGINMQPLIDLLPQFCKKVIVLPGTGTDRIKNDLDKLGSLVERVSNLPTALEKAFDATKKGDTLLFSPAFASFGLFKNEYDRSDQFVELVKKYIA